MLFYLSSLPPARAVLWCYLWWYVVMVGFHFDPSAGLWLSSIGISAIIGVALVLSTGRSTRELGRWAVFRLFLMPFCVSSYSALIKGQGFVLLFSPKPIENLLAAALCIIFLGVWWACRSFVRRRTTEAALPSLP